MQPPFEFRVTDVITAQTLINQNWPTKTITLLGQEYPAGIPSQGAHHLTVQLDDITYPAPGWNTPSTFHVDTILKFSKGFEPTDRVLFHCFAGISRSTATAIGVLCQHQISPTDAVVLVEQATAGLDPNELILFHFDSLLGLKLGLMDSYRSWSVTQNGRLVNRMPRNFSAELERNAREYYSQMSQRKSIKNMDLL
jgi:predicted protein tyrosine phosphatase